jgi:hypothetical protein
MADGNASSARRARRTSLAWRLSHPRAALSRTRPARRDDRRRVATVRSNSSPVTGASDVGYEQPEVGPRLPPGPARTSARDRPVARLQPTPQPAPKVPELASNPSPGPPAPAPRSGRRRILAQTIPAARDAAITDRAPCLIQRAGRRHAVGPNSPRIRQSKDPPRRRSEVRDGRRRRRPDSGPSELEHRSSSRAEQARSDARTPGLCPLGPTVPPTFLSVGGDCRTRSLLTDPGFGLSSADSEEGGSPFLLRCKR